ncbi:SH3 domain-containing protein [Chitinilyticum piscinae]|uniref:SH3 domain-containing protein n=1 Tax=Chitinilyticum piscinae TaxID=2866724 RepID=A0A8J7FPU0_9NEIS|nr:SH3 domain-containing protein [Chitinilyticum piscinae]MBE9611011.1 SH3 domain-containing protein [Chitinilyticum piscinae]
MRIPFMAALLPALLAGAAWAESGSVIRETELRQKPFSDASVVSKLATGATVDILNRQGAWMNVRSSGQEGWVKMLSVRLSEGGSTDAGSALSQGIKVVTTGSSGKTVSTGVKGLSEEELTRAQPDYNELEQLNKLGVSTAEASKQAASAKLSANQVPAIAVSGARSSGSSSTSSPTNSQRRP